MEQKTIDTMRECAHASYEGTLKFPAIVQKLIDAGVAQYHADFFRDEITYYLANGESYVEPTPSTPVPIASKFDSSEVAAAVKASQQEGMPYKTFLTRVRAAGCTGYVVYLDGQRVIYSGRKGEMHTEYFPGSQP